ncbi:MAG: hypothetical protein ABIQ39_10470, partial [Ilumatobacteraceae bacterium]
GRYRAMLNSHDVGIALQDTPHPGLVSLDMAAAGLTTITSTYATKCAADLAAISANIVAVEPDPKVLADAIACAVNSAGDLQRRSAAAEFDWPRSAAQALSSDLITRMLTMIDGTDAPAGCVTDAIASPWGEAR